MQIQYKMQESGLNLADTKFTKLENRLFKNVCGYLKNRFKCRHRDRSCRFECRW